MAATTPLPTFEPPAAPAAPSPFDAKLGFDRFIVARSNILAANAARRMAMEEAPQFNPLYLCSGTGQGKTHLLHAIAQAYAAAHPRSEEHTSELQSLMRISYAVFCLKKQNKTKS